MHASFYLAAATAVSTLPAYAAESLAGNVPGLPDWLVWIVALTAALGYGIGASTEQDQGPSDARPVTCERIPQFSQEVLAERGSEVIVAGISY
jgi:hypothetical protein